MCVSVCSQPKLIVTDARSFIGQYSIYVLGFDRVTKVKNNSIYTIEMLKNGR